MFIAEKNVTAVYQLSGGMIAFLIDAIGRLGQTKIVNTRHEQAAGFAAEGSARVTQKPGVAMGTSGPGATNLITPIASSYFDSIPVIYITGQVNQKELRINPNQRQNGFQELDICEMAKTITKKVYRPTTAKEAFKALEEGWLLAQDGRQGPVLIDIPINLQQEELEYDSNGVDQETIEVKADAKVYDEFKGYLFAAKRPLILVGGGVRLSGASELLAKFIFKTGIPYVSSLLGLDSVSHSDDKFLGFIGSYGNRWANAAVSESDLLIVLGSRLDVRQTGNNISHFIANKKIIRVDIDDNELTGRIPSDLVIKSDVLEFLQILIGIDYKFDNVAFIAEIKNMKQQRPQEFEQITGLKLNPNTMMEWLSETFAQASGYVVDVGQHQMWAAQSIRLKSGQRFLTSGGLGAMGFAMPASIGAAVSTNSNWVMISGDGCLQLSSSELQTIVQYNLPITVCVINNGQHGMVAQFQEENMNGRLIGTREGFSNPNFQELARAYGFLNVYKVESESELIELSSSIKEWKDGPSFLEFIIDGRAQALPKNSF
jgi:acetolactate synthase I/II/III large subunit